MYKNEDQNFSFIYLIKEDGATEHWTCLEVDLKDNKVTNDDGTMVGKWQWSPEFDVKWNKKGEKWKANWKPDEDEDSD